MRKNLIVVLICIIGVIAIFTVTQNNHSDSLNNENSQVITLRFGHNISTNSAMHEAALKFAEEVSKQSQHKLKITIHPNQELGNDHQMVEMARGGELDILLTPTAKMSVPVPAVQFADLPFLFPDRETAYKVLDGESGQMLLNKLGNIGLIGVTFWENGFKHFTANKSVTTLEDFEGLKMRVMKSRIIIEQFNALNATPIPIDFHMTRQALADGVVDGQENPLIAIVGMKLHEVQSHMTLSSHAYLGYILSFSAKSFERLNKDHRQVLLNAAKAVTPWQRQETKRREDDLIKVITDSGVIVETITPEERQRFVQKTHSITDEFKLIIGADILSKAGEIIGSSTVVEQRNQ